MAADVVKEMYINESAGHTRLAIVENGKLVELYIERPDHKRMVGSMAGMGEMLDPRFGNKKQRAQLALFIAALCDGLSFIDHVCPDGVDMKAQVKLFDRMVRSLAIDERGSKK